MAEIRIKCSMLQQPPLHPQPLCVLPRPSSARIITAVVTSNCAIHQSWLNRHPWKRVTVPTDHWCDNARRR